MTTKTPAAAAQPHRDIVLVDLGLQGGGAHGALSNSATLERTAERPFAAALWLGASFGVIVSSLVLRGVGGPRDDTPRERGSEQPLRGL